MSEAGAAASGAPPPWPAGAAWIDGRYCPIEDAKISVLDLGVTRSDCTYDVVHVWQGRFYRLGAHLDRFAASMARLRLDPGHDRTGIEAIVHGCVRHQVDEGRLTAEDLLRSDEVLATSTAGGIMPVTVIDGQPVGTGAPGPLTRQLRDRYWASHEDPRYSTPVRYDEPD